jgi:hypothetical protein
VALMRQVAPYPDDLAAVVAEAGYRPGWSFRLDPDCGRHAGARGLTLIISVETVDAYAPGEPFTVTHPRWVPPEPYGRAAWARWLFDQIALVELHERMEFFTIGGQHPFPPGHGGGDDPYHSLPV